MPKLAACLHLLVSRDMRFNVKDLACRSQETYMPTYRMISVMESIQQWSGLVPVASNNSRQRRMSHLVVTLSIRHLGFLTIFAMSLTQVPLSESSTFDDWEPEHIQSDDISGYFCYHGQYMAFPHTL
jgi:hypothetical protein